MAVMRGFIQKIFGFLQSGEEGSSLAGPVNGPSKDIERIINETVHSLVRKWHVRLLSEPLDYIIYAAWGARMDGELTKDQLAIHAELEPVFDTIVAIMDIKRLNEEQDFAVRYLIRSLFIAKITFIIDHMSRELADDHIPPPETSGPSFPADLFDNLFSQNEDRRYWNGGRRW